MSLEHDVEWTESVRPPKWPRPVPATKYDLVVVGAGPAGLVTAAAAAGLGARTALVEKRLMGGDCLNFGCVPSKALLRAARAAAEIRDGRRFGAAAAEPFDAAAAMTRVRALRARLARHDSAERFAGLGVDVYFGGAVFVAPDALEVDGLRLKFRRACIATGAGPAVPPIPGLEDVGVLTNETVFGLAEPPRTLLVVGGGPIGCELAQAFARLGSRTTLIEGADRLLPRDDAEASPIVRASLVRDGVDVRTATKVVAASKTAHGRTLKLESGAGIAEVSGDEVLVAVGRAPHVADLGLDAADVRFDRRGGVEVDRRLRTSNPRIFAAGDVCSRLQFTHAADAAARVVVQNALFLPTASLPSVVPWCTFVDPEVAHVGSTEVAAAQDGVAFDVRRAAFEDLDRPRLDGEAEGFVKVLLSRGSDRLLGVTVVGAHAGELIGEFSSAMTLGIGLRAMGRAVRPYPTRSEVVRRLADGLNRERLTPAVHRLLGAVRWLRALGT